MKTSCRAFASAEYNKLLCIAFIDHKKKKKTFDSVDTGAQLEALRDRGVQEIYIRLWEDIHKECIREQEEGEVPFQEVREIAV